MVDKQGLLSKLSAFPENNIHKQKILRFLTENEDFWSKQNEAGQVTAACWVVNKERTKALLTHHKKLNRWLQIGGHLEVEDNTIIDACKRELKEESGLSNFTLVGDSIFDLDVHTIPKSKNGVLEHIHYDFRFLFEADENETIDFDKAESNEIKWIPFEEILKLGNESISRMVEKSLKY